MRHALAFAVAFCCLGLTADLVFADNPAPKQTAAPAPDAVMAAKAREVAAKSAAHAQAATGHARDAQAELIKAQVKLDGLCDEIRTLNRKLCGKDECSAGDLRGCPAPGAQAVSRPPAGAAPQPLERGLTAAEKATASVMPKADRQELRGDMYELNAIAAKDRENHQRMHELATRIKATATAWHLDMENGQPVNFDTGAITRAEVPPAPPSGAPSDPKAGKTAKR